MGESEPIDFAYERSIRRPDETPVELQRVLNQCADEEVVGGSIDNAHERSQDYRSRYILDLGKRMLTQFRKSGGKITKPIRDNFDRLSPDDQDEVIAVYANYKRLEGEQ